MHRYIRGQERITSNRFEVDSNRYWKAEFHPRFGDIFTPEEFETLFERAMEVQSFPLDTNLTDLIGAYFFDYFSGFRFSLIPSKNIYAKDQFKGALFKVFYELARNMSIRDFKLKDDDFNVVNNTGKSSKNDRTSVDTKETSREGSNKETYTDYNAQKDITNEDGLSVENIDYDSDFNEKGSHDEFLSPQNQGLTPLTENTRGAGVSGIMIATGANFLTAGTRDLTGNSTVDKTNTSSANRTSKNSLIENEKNSVDLKTNTELYGDKGVNVELLKGAEYQESLDFHRGGRLKEFLDMGMTSLLDDALASLDGWILSADIALGTRDYYGTEVYD